MYAMDSKNHNIDLSSAGQQEIVIRMVKAGVNKIIPETISQFALRFNEKEIKKSILPSGRTSVQQLESLFLKKIIKRKLMMHLQNFTNLLHMN